MKVLLLVITVCFWFILSPRVARTRWLATQLFMPTDKFTASIRYSYLCVFIFSPNTPNTVSYLPVLIHNVKDNMLICISIDIKNVLKVPAGLFLTRKTTNITDLLFVSLGVTSPLILTTCSCSSDVSLPIFLDAYASRKSPNVSISQQ